jgi:hypothetical protein
MAKHWIAGAVKHPGALTRAAKASGQSNSSYAREHQHDSGKAGQRARFALQMEKFMREKGK